MSKHDSHEKPKSHAPHGPPGAHGGHEEHEGAPEWLISFADNVTLMMGFFVIMLAMNLGPKGGSGTDAAEAGAVGSPPSDFLDVALAIRDAFNNPVGTDSTNPTDWALVQRLLQKKGKGPVDANGPIGREELQHSLSPGRYLSNIGIIPFETGTSRLTEKARTTAQEIAAQLTGYRLLIIIRGHSSTADADADSSSDSGMRLSFERALAVADALVEAGIERKRIRLVACGDGDRARQNAYSPPEQMENQRAEVIMTESLAPLGDEGKEKKEWVEYERH